MAHAHAMEASRVAVARAAWSDAVGWLELAASCAATTDEISAAEQAMAALPEHAAGRADVSVQEAWSPRSEPLRRLDVDLQPGQP
jgi:hypothetical protein